MIRFLLLSCFAFCFCINVSALAICNHNLGDTTVQLLAKDSLKTKKKYKNIIEKSLGRPLTFLERVNLFCFGKRVFVTALPLDEQIKLANNTVGLSFWLALASILIPPSIFFSILYKNSNVVNKKYLTEKSKKRLKFIGFMEKFWIVFYALLFIAMIVAIAFLAIYGFALIFKALLTY